MKSVLSLLTVTFSVLLSHSANGQNKFNNILPEWYSNYKEAFVKANLNGPVKSVKYFAVSDEYFNTKKIPPALRDTLVRQLWFELDKNKELISVASMKSKKVPYWKLTFRNKLPVKGWRSLDNDSLIVSEIYTYSGSGLLEKHWENKLGYENTTHYYYEGNTPIRSESFAKEIKNVREWIERNDSTFLMPEYAILKDGRKIFQRSSKFVIGNNKTTEIWYEADRKKEQPADIFSPENEYFRRTRILNKQKLVIWEKSKFSTDPGPTTYKYKYDYSGRMTYHEQEDPKLKQIWESFYNGKGQMVKFTGKAYENGKELYATVNIRTYDKFGNMTSDDQSGSLHTFKYTYDSHNNWIRKEIYIGTKLFETELRKIEYY